MTVAREQRSAMRARRSEDDRIGSGELVVPAGFGSLQRDFRIERPASLWEIAIKSGLGRHDFRVDGEALRRGLLDNDYRELPVTGLHALATARLPMLHSDPFDRILVAQARSEGLVLATSDAAVAAYGAATRLV